MISGSAAGQHDAQQPRARPMPMAAADHSIFSSTARAP